MSFNKTYFKLQANKFTSLAMESYDQASTSIGSDNENTIVKVGSENVITKKQYSPLEWIQLIATICIPIIIAVYTIIDNNNKESIASADRRKDIEIANSSRSTQFDIAEANRLHEILIAEQNQQKDRDLALDQQRENILVQYQKWYDFKCDTDSKVCCFIHDSYHIESIRCETQRCSYSIPLSFQINNTSTN